MARAAGRRPIALFSRPELVNPQGSAEIPARKGWASSMNEAEFERRASEVLDRLFEQIEDQLGDWLDVEMAGGILQIELPAGGTYVINKHAPNREIWMSSPRSGAWHFGPAGDGWRSTRGTEELTELLAGELAAASGRTVRLAL